MSSSSSPSALPWLLQFCHQHRWILICSVCLAAIAATLSLAPYYFVYLIADSLLTQVTDQQAIWWFTSLALAAMLLRYGCLLLSTYLAHSSAFHIQYQIRTRLFRHMSRIPLGYFNQTSSGEIKKVLAEDIDRVEVFIAHQLADLVTALFVPLTTFVLLCFIDYRMALFALIPIPLAAISQAMMFRGYKEKAQQYHHNLEQLNSAVTEFARAMPVIRLFAMQQTSHTKLEQGLAQHRQYLAKWIKEAAWPMAAFKAFLNSGLAVLVPIGLYFWLDGSLTIAQFIICLLLGVGMLEPLFNLTLLSTYLGQVFEGVGRLIKIEQLPQESVIAQANDSNQSASKPKLEHHQIRFEQVSFHYPETNKSALQNISFELKPHTVTAIVGGSGAGKSTLIHLLARMWQPSRGQIYLDDQPLSDYSEAQLMDQMSLVFQDSHLFKLTIRDNITMGKPYSFQQIEAAAKAANAHQFIEQLPQGYDTLLSDGVSLSGGQKQRIAIARAMLKDAPILVLDEPTAHADATNQKLIQSAISELAQGKTVVVIAHQLSTVVNADQILVLNDGLLVECGSHQQLLEQQGHYAQLWNTQQTAKQWKIKPSQMAEQQPEVQHA